MKVDTNKLKHRVTFYKLLYTEGFAGTGTQSLTAIRTLRAQIQHVSDKELEASKISLSESLLKMTTHFVSDLDKNMCVSIFGHFGFYDIVSMENVAMLNQTLIFKLRLQNAIQY